jgi:hypothetical protein
MAEDTESRDRSICSMYRDGVSLRTLEVAFGLGESDIIGVLRRGCHLEQRPGESDADFVERIRQDVKHAV